jgi:hypothetical protein
MTQNTIRDFSNNYQPKTAKNITELKIISVELEVKNEKGTDLNGEEYSYNYVEVNNEKYRLPDSVAKDLKQILAKKPDLKNFAVSKTGEGRNTKYTVIPLD